MDFNERSTDPATRETPAVAADMIRQRAMLLREVRQWFDERGFFEVQPPCLSSESIIDRYIDPVQVRSDQFQTGSVLPDPFYLQTSPEAAMKRLLAAGAPSIYSLGPVFRSGERGQWHNLEFTMLEWYQRDSDLEQAVQLLGSFATQMLHRDAFEVCTYRQLFHDHLDVDPIDADLGQLQQLVAELDDQLSNSLAGDRDGMLDVLLSQRIQPAIADGRVTIVTHYPLSQAALARPAEDDPACAARFELFVDGVELANGYDELCDADVLQQRMHHSNQQRLQIGKKVLPIPRKLISAMRHGLPPCAGVALGFDRLLMVRTGETEISRVLSFPLHSA